MSIRIYSEGMSGTAASEASRAQEVSRAGDAGKPSTKSTTSGEDQVSISSLSESLAAQGSQHAARVQHLKALYQSGKYAVNAAEVSHAIVNHALKAGQTESGS